MTPPTSRMASPMELRLSRRHRIRLVGEGVLVGIAVGATIALYRLLLSHAEQLLRVATGWLAGQGALLLLWFAVLAALLVVVGRLMLWEPYTQGSGIPQVDAEVAGRINTRWRRVLPVKFVEGVLCALAGLSLGREGPSVLLGGMAGKGVSQALGNGRAHERLLVTCGAAAGMSAAFHAPLTGVLFAVEEIHKEFGALLVTSVMSASVAADLVASQLLGVAPVIHFVGFSSLPHDLYPAVLLMGLCCGVLGCLHNKVMFFFQDRVFGPLEPYGPYVRLAMPFALAGVLAFVWPDLLCGGDAILDHVLHARSETLGVLLALLVGKLLFTSVCFGSGAPGGTLFPLVVIGALAGASYGLGAMAAAGVSGAYENSFVALGIAGLFASVIQAPVTAVVLVFELTGSLEALLATSMVSLVSYVVACVLRTEPYYEHLYARMLGDDAPAGETAQRDEKVLHRYVVGTGSAVEGRLVSEVAWPQGALVVTVSRAGDEIVAHGSTRLGALDELCVVMGSRHEYETDQSLRALCTARD